MIAEDGYSGYLEYVLQIHTLSVTHYFTVSNGFCCIFPYLACAESNLGVGVTPQKVSDSAMMQSTSYSYVQGYKARLYHGNYWGPVFTDKLAVLKIDFGSSKIKITAIAVQSGYGYFVSAYELSYSVNGWSWRHWIEHGSEKVLNKEKNSRTRSWNPAGTSGALTLFSRAKASTAKRPEWENGKENSILSRLTQEEACLCNTDTGIEPILFCLLHIFSNKNSSVNVTGTSVTARVFAIYP